MSKPYDIKVTRNNNTNTTTTTNNNNSSSGPAICYCACVMAKSQRGIRNTLIQINLRIAAVSQIDLWFARFTGLI